MLDGSTMAQDATRDAPSADLPVLKLVLPRPCEGTTLIATARTVCDGAGRIECRQWGATTAPGLTTYACCLDIAFQCIITSSCQTFDLSSCRCGAESPSREGEICAATTSGGGASMRVPLGSLEPGRLPARR